MTNFDTPQYLPVNAGFGTTSGQFKSATSARANKNKLPACSENITANRTSGRQGVSSRQFRLGVRKQTRFASRPVYTCDFWCDFWRDFAYKMRLTLPCTNVVFVKHRVDWKESYHILFHIFQFLLTWRYFVAELRDYKPVRGRLWQVLYAKSHQNRIKIASKSHV